MGSVTLFGVSGIHEILEFMSKVNRDTALSVFPGGN